MTTTTRPRIALLAAPESSASVLYGLYDILLSVGPAWPDMTAAAPGDALLDVVIVGATGDPFRCFGGILVEPHASVDDVGPVDAIVVCDLYTPIAVPPRGLFRAESAWIRQAHDDGVLIATVCTGSLLLAEAGLLDGRSCAGHWAYADLFESAYPRISFLPGAILDLSSERAGFVTAGGVTSWQDLALYLIARFCGPEHASRTAKVYLLGSHEDGQLPYSAMARNLRAEDPVIGACISWIGANPAVANPVSAMVDRSGLTGRTFARRFRAATGRRPIDYVHALRIEEARRLLESGPGPVDEIGYELGYTDPTFFRRLFKRTTGLTPAAYRRMYASLTGRASTAIGRSG